MAGRDREDPVEPSPRAAPVTTGATRAAVPARAASQPAPAGDADGDPRESGPHDRPSGVPIRGGRPSRRDGVLDRPRHYPGSHESHVQRQAEVGGGGGIRPHLARLRRNGRGPACDDEGPGRSAPYGHRRTEGTVHPAARRHGQSVPGGPCSSTPGRSHRSGPGRFPLGRQEGRPVARAVQPRPRGGQERLRAGRQPVGPRQEDLRLQEALGRDRDAPAKGADRHRDQRGAEPVEDEARQGQAPDLRRGRGRDQ